MSLKSIIKGLGKAIPVIIANAPAVITAFREVKRAVKKPSTKAAPEA